MGRRPGKKICGRERGSARMPSEPLVGPPVLAAGNKRLGRTMENYTMTNQTRDLTLCKKHNHLRTLHQKCAHHAEPYCRCVLARLNTTTAQQRAIRTRADLQRYQGCRS